MRRALWLLPLAGAAALAGVILLRPRLSELEYVVRFTLTALAQQIKWEGQFSVAQEGKLRLVPLHQVPKAKSRRPRKRKK